MKSASGAPSRMAAGVVRAPCEDGIELVFYARRCSDSAGDCGVHRQQAVHLPTVLRGSRSDQRRFGVPVHLSDRRYLLLGAREHQRSVDFLFGMDAHPTLVKRAAVLVESAWKRLQRREKYTMLTGATLERYQSNEKERIVVEREYVNLRLNDQDVAEFSYRPGNCSRVYRGGPRTSAR